MKKINLLKSVMILLGILFLLNSCRQELATLQNENAQKTNQLSIKKLNQLQISENSILMKNLLKFENKKTGKSNSTQKEIYNAIYDFTIITDNAVEIIKDTIKTYTFTLKRNTKPQGIALENLLAVEKQKKIVFYLVQYHITEQELQDFEAGKKVDFTGNVSMTKLAEGTVSLSTSRLYTCLQYGGEQYVEGRTCIGTGKHTNPNDPACNYKNDAGAAQVGYWAPIYYISSCDDGYNGFTGYTGSTIPTTSTSYPVASGLRDAMTFFQAMFPSPLSTSDSQVRNWYLEEGALQNSMLDELYYYYNNPTIPKSPERLAFCKWAFLFCFNNKDDIEWSQFQPMLTFAQKFLQENPDTQNPEQLFQRIKDLDDAVKQNPDLLLDIPCSELPKWKDVANHQVPQELKNKLNNIQGQTNWFNSWEIQNIDNAFGPSLNMDLFPIRITNMPYKPNSNQKYTPAEFFNFFRKNINLFAEKFTPIEDNQYNIHDTALWNSSNPLGALIHIEIPGDNGTVMCTGYNVSSNSGAWVFTTIKAPIKLDGIHPVSGHRLFGYWVDNNGFMYIFTRGVDRFTNPVPTKTFTYLSELYAFSKADDLWTGMQNKLVNYIEKPENGGLANKISSEIYRPDFSKINNYLKGNTTIQSLGCK